MARVTEKQCFRCAHDLLSGGYRRLGDHPGPKRHQGPGDEFEQCRFLWTDQPRHSGRENTSARAHTRGLADAHPVEVLHTEARQHPEIIGIENRDQRLGQRRILIRLHLSGEHTARHGRANISVQAIQAREQVPSANARDLRRGREFHAPSTTARSSSAAAASTLPSSSR